MADSSLRHDGRKPDQLRPISFQAGIAPNATGSVLVSFGATRVICAANIEPKVPGWMRQQGVKGGWLTAEYSMLPYSTLDRKPRDISKGKIDGRTVEIQRLIGRSLRAVVDRKNSGKTRSGSIATCCRPMAARARPRSLAPTWPPVWPSKNCSTPRVCPKPAD